MLSLKNITVKYPGGDGPPAIADLNLDIAEGDYLSILGSNGCGKTTLVKAICGMVELQSGEISIADRIVRPGRFGEDLFGTVAAVFQEPGGQFLMPDVRTELMTALQNLGLNRNEQRRRFDDIVAGFSLENILESKPEELSGGQMQIVHLACAMALSPEVLLLDEPTTFLDCGYRRRLLDLMDMLNSGGLTIVHVTQYPAEAARADKTAVMNSGTISALGPPESILKNESLLTRNRLFVPAEYVFENLFGFHITDQKAADEYCSRIPGDIQRDQAAIAGFPNEDRVLEVRDLRFNYPHGGFALEIDRLSLFRGSVTGIVGPAGSGKSTLAFLLAGLLKPSRGDILFDGELIFRFSPKKLRRMIGIGWQMPDAVLTGPAVSDDLNSIIENLGLTSVIISQVLQKVSLAGFENRIVDTLSGGEKRKVALAGTLLSDPEIIILDEPAAFLDPISQSELATIIQELAKSGKSIAVIAHDLPFLSEICSRIVALRSGRILFDVPAVDYFDDPSWSEKIDFPADPLVGFRRRLRNAGLRLDKPSLKPSYIAERLGSQAAEPGNSLDN